MKHADFTPAALDEAAVDLYYAAGRAVVFEPGLPARCCDHPGLRAAVEHYLDVGRRRGEHEQFHGYMELRLTTREHQRGAERLAEFHAAHGCDRRPA